MSSPKKNKTEKRLETLAVKTNGQKRAFLEQLPKYPIVQVACEKSGVGRSTYYAWRKSDKEFAKQADESIRSGELFINDMAESKLIQNIQDGNNTAIIFWLKNHHKSYNERIVHEHEHSLELEDEDKKAIAKALINIGLGNILKSYDIDPKEWHERQERERTEHQRRVHDLLNGVGEKKEEEVDEEEPTPQPHTMALPKNPPVKRPAKKGVDIKEFFKKRDEEKRRLEGK